MPSIMVLGCEAFGVIRSSEWSFMNGSNALIKEAPERSPSICGDTARSQPSTTCKRAFPRTWLCWQPDLQIPGSRTLRNKFLLLISHPDYGILFNSLNELRQLFSIFSFSIFSPWATRSPTFLSKISENWIGAFITILNINIFDDCIDKETWKSLWSTWEYLEMDFSVDI